MFRKVAVVATLVVGVLPAVSGGQPASATFPGNNGKLVYSSNVDGDYEIFAVPPTGAPVQLTHNALIDQDPAFSADGKLIYWDQERPSGKKVIMVMKKDGTGQKALTSPKRDSWDPSPGPTGKIAFARTISGSSDIFIMRADGSKVTQVTSTGRYEDEPAWSPTGKLIAFVRSYRFYSTIFTMHPDGSHKGPITATGADYYDPSFSPDGTHIAADTDLTGLSDIYTMKNDGSHLTQVTSDASFREILPRYSPDGTQISYSTDADGDMEIVTQLLAGGGFTQLTDNGATDNNGSWGSA
jgi:Tol biopolymer transport system component